MKKLKKRFLALLIVLSMVFTSHAFVTFAENVESATDEIELEYDGASETLVGASSTSPEEKSDESEIEEPEDDTDESLETDYPEEPEEDETEYAEEPEEDETESIVGASSTSPEEETSNSEETAETEVEVETETEAEEAIVGAMLGELEEETAVEETTVVENDDLAAVETNTENKLYGATPHKFILVGKDDDDAGTTIKFTVDDTIANYGVWGNGWNDSGLVTGGEKHGKRGFYTIAQGDSLDEDAVVSSWDETHAIDPDSNAKYNSYVQDKFQAWFDNPTYDIAFGYLFGDEPAPTPTESKFCIKYFNITSTNWASIASRAEVHNIMNNPIVKEFTASTDTSEVAAAIGTLGYTNGFKKLTKDEYDNYTGIGAATHTSDEEINNIGKENGVFDQWKLSPTETVYYGINYYYYDAEMNYAENHSGTWEIYDNTFDWNTDLSPHELVAFHNNNAEEAIVLPQVTVKGSDTYKMRNTSTGDIQYIWTWALQPGGMQERSFGNTENAWPFKPETKTLTLYAQWYGSTPTPPAPTPVTTDWYWYLNGTHMHYTATAGAGRTKVTFNGDLGVDYGSTNVETVKEVTIDDKISPENLHGLFRLFKSLTKINSFTNLDTSNCTDMGRMFQSCSSLENISVSHFNTSKVKDMSRVFQNCEKLKSVDVSNFDTQNAETMHQMFGTCIVITDIIFSSKFVTNKVTKMYEMFSRCEKITSLDISSFDISSVTNADDMFASCHELVTIKTSPTLDFSSVGSGNDMFKYCFKIKGGNGTTYDENHVDKAYAHVDGGTSNPGYFTGGSSPTPPGPTPGPSPSPGGGESGGSSSDSSDPAHGPMGDLSKNPEYANKINNGEIYTENNLPQESLKKDDNLATHLKSLPENSNSSYSNARDSYGNTGYGQWLRVPNTTTWYFYSGDLSQINGQSSGFLANGWYNLGWDGQDKWYYFDSNGVMKIGWHKEGNKIYYLQADFDDNWYGKVMTGTHIIDGQVRNFDSNGVLMQ